MCLIAKKGTEIEVLTEEKIYYKVLNRKHGVYVSPIQGTRYSNNGDLVELKEDPILMNGFGGPAPSCSFPDIATSEEVQRVEGWYMPAYKWLPLITRGGSKHFTIHSYGFHILTTEQKAVEYCSEMACSTIVKVIIPKGARILYGIQDMAIVDKFQILQGKW